MSIQSKNIVEFTPSQEISFPNVEITRIGLAIQELAQDLESRYYELQKIMHITAQVNAGMYLEEILESVYRDFKDFIPYDRIGFSLFEDGGNVIRAHWAKAEYEPLRLGRGFSARIEGSTLEMIIQSGQPRIINDLEAYAKQKPESKSTRLVLEEGIRSSLTCPLIANGTPIGFMFFSSREPNTYAHAHIEIFQHIASQLAIMVEKGKLITKLATQKEELLTKNNELERLNNLKNSFLGVAAHDLRNPISNIQLAVSLMMDNRFNIPEDEQQVMFTEITNQTHYMLSLLDELLDISHIESGKFSLDLKPIELSDFLTDVVQRHNRLAGVKGTSIHLDPVPAGSALADPMRLQQIMDNLVSNAVKYSPEQSNIFVHTVKTEDEWRVSVQDEGPGLTQADQQRLFKDFARLSAKPTGGEKSTGLGLAITKRVIEAHGGQIGVESTPGSGATFWFTLKRA